MKFLVISGRKKGVELEVENRPLTIGRRKENDLILDDESVSGCHARIAVEDGRVFVEDCDSINGIELNGKAVKKAFLGKGDVLTVGMTQIKVVDGTQPAAEPAMDSKEEADSPPPDKTRQMTRPAAPVRSAQLKNAIAAILVVVVIVAGYVILKRQPPRVEPSAGAPAAPSFAETVFRLSYEKVQASGKNIFRCEVKIVNDSLFVAVDDLKQGRQIRENKKLEPSAIVGLTDAIAEQQIFALPPLTQGQSPDVWDSYTLNVVQGGRTCAVRVINRIPPDNFKRVCSTIEQFAEQQTGIQFTKTVEEVKRLAAESYQRARKLHDEQRVREENLFNAIRAYVVAIKFLEEVEPKPPIYADAIRYKDVATAELDGKVSDCQFQAARAEQLGEWPKAYEALRTILQMIPDPADARNREAKKRLLAVEEKLRPK